MKEKLDRLQNWWLTRVVDGPYFAPWMIITLASAFAPLAWIIWSNR